MAFYYISCMRIILIQFVILLLINDLSEGMECEFGHESSFLDKFNVINPTSCPTILDSDKEYCCKSGNRVYCCDAGEFLGNGFFIGDGVKNYIKDHFPTLEHSSYEYPTNYVTTVSRSEESFGVLLPVLIGVAVVLLIVCCLCCLCCPCCLLYKRRHRGTVYGRVQTVVAVQQPAQQHAPVYPPQPTHMPMPASGYSQPAYPVYPPQQGQQPPPYSEATTHELYTKQSPYNPSFQ